MALEKYFSKAEITFEKFHVMKMVGNVVDEFRNRTRPAYLATAA
ncbi:transposase [Paenibacillus tianmuensis]